MMIIAGEASGDAHAAELVAELRRRHPQLHFFGCGGPRLEAAGCELLVSYKQLNVLGLFEVATHLPRIYGLLRQLRRAMRRRHPLAVILVDFPDFNLRLARRAFHWKIPVIYFISPQLWAWRSRRVNLIRRTVQRMICIFPFEAKFYAQHGVTVASVGHPLEDRIARARASFPDAEAFRAGLGLDPETELVALLPGSRHREVAFHLDTMLEAARRLRAEHNLAFVIPVAPTLDPDELQNSIPPPMRAWVHLIRPENTYAAIAHSRLAIVASGTATVETAILGTPMVVVYRLSSLTYRLGRRWVRTPWVAMVNLIADKAVVPELIQEGFEPAAIVNWANRLLPEGPERERMRNDLSAVRAKLGAPGAIGRAATEVEMATAGLRKSPALAAAQPHGDPAEAGGAGQKSGQE